jgi:hypothetical protein
MRDIKSCKFCFEDVSIAFLPKTHLLKHLTIHFYNNIKSTILKTKFPIKTHVGMYSQNFVFKIVDLILL